MSWLIPRDELTADQIRAVELSPNEHRVILGAPGSGKTQILLHRARHLSEEYGVRPERFHVFVFTKVLKNYIRTALIDLDLPEECVSTLDDWCIQLYRQTIGYNLPRDRSNGKADYAAVRRAVHNQVKDCPLFDFVMVDEGQDLDSEAFALLQDLAPHVTVAMDHKQQIYERGSDEVEIIRALGLRRSNLTLLDAFRCCPYIVRVASEFIEDPREREAFLNQSRTSQTEIQTPLLHEANGFDDEFAQLVEVLRERQIVDRTIAILLAKNDWVEGVARDLCRRAIPVETRKSGLDFSNSIPKVLTIHSAKGLTFDTVLLPRLVPNCFGKLSVWAQRLLYVGITRATKWVYLSTIAGKAIPELRRVFSLAELNPPPVTLSRPDKASPHARWPSHPPDEDELLDII
jgi:superfamily I DNA/RNA helicase